MKKTLFAIVVLVATLFSCSEPDPIKDAHEKIKKNFTGYFQNHMGDKSVLDSISIISIDTLTEKKALELKLPMLEQKYNIVYEKSKSQQTIISSGKGLNFDQDIIDSYERDLDKIVTEGKSIQNQYKETQNKIKTADDKKFKYNYVRIKLHYTEKMAAKQLEIQVPANEEFKVVEILDL